MSAKLIVDGAKLLFQSAQRGAKLAAGFKAPITNTTRRVFKQGMAGGYAPAREAAERGARLIKNRWTNIRRDPQKSRDMLTFVTGAGAATAAAGAALS